MESTIPPRVSRICLLAALLTAGLAAAPDRAGAEPSHAIAMHGEPALPADFSHFDYVNPEAPKGGRLALGVVGTFDSLNPFIVQGVAARGLREYVFESLMARGLDEPFTLYGLLAESVDVPDDRSSALFRLRPQARFSDGAPVTPEDVIFSWDTLKRHGRPNHRTYYSLVTAVEKVGEDGVRFTFGGSSDREIPLIIGLMPILPKHHYESVDFEKSGNVPPIGSGPYVVGRVDRGSLIEYRRNPSYWGRDLPVTRGRFNFDEIRIEFFRNETALHEAFKKGLVDVLPELDPARWATEYRFPAVNDGRVVLDELSSGVPRGMSGLVFNTRRPQFADRRVRQALSMLFDGEWIDRTLYHGLFERTASYFEGSELSARGVPASERERELLAPWGDRVLPEIMDGSYEPPRTDGSGRDRNNLRAALALLGEAGYETSGGVMRNRETGAPLAFEILVATPEQERLALTYATQLKRAGIQASVRQVDSAQFERRRQTYDFDMIQFFWFASLSPGNEQKFYWGSAAAGQDGTRNYMGVADPAVDAMIEALLAAREREEFVDAVRALDRVLMSGSYVIPLFHTRDSWVARWSHIGRPERMPLYGYELDTWWRVQPEAVDGRG